MKICKLLLAVASAGLLLAALGSAASARRLSFSSNAPTTSFRELRFVSDLGSSTCPVTLEGSLHVNTISKVAESLIGSITRTRLGFCQIGTATIPAETLPWHVRYSSFGGLLPAISRVNVNIIGFTMKYRDTSIGLLCTIRSTATEPLIGTYNVSGGVITGESVSGTIATTFEECIGKQFIFSSDAGAVVALGTTTRVTIRLI